MRNKLRGIIILMIGAIVLMSCKNNNVENEEVSDLNQTVFKDLENIDPTTIADVTEEYIYYIVYDENKQEIMRRDTEGVEERVLSIDNKKSLIGDFIVVGNTYYYTLLEFLDTDIGLDEDKTIPYSIIKHIDNKEEILHREYYNPLAGVIEYQVIDNIAYALFSSVTNNNISYSIMNLDENKIIHTFEDVMMSEDVHYAEYMKVKLKKDYENIYAVIDKRTYVLNDNKIEKLFDFPVGSIVKVEDKYLFTDADFQDISHLLDVTPHPQKLKIANLQGEIEKELVDQIYRFDVLAISKDSAILSIMEVNDEFTYNEYKVSFNNNNISLDLINIKEKDIKFYNATNGSYTLKYNEEFKGIESLTYFGKKH